MTTVTKLCGKCGAKVFAEAPQEFCSACLLETGLGLLADGPVAGVDSSDVASAKADDPSRNDGVPAPDRKKTARPAKILGDFGDYELLEEIGRGGQGVVYRAHQKSLNRTVALKVIGLGHWATEAHIKRFRREAESAASLEHPCIVPIYEVGERDGSCYFSMKFIEGGQLDEVVRPEPMSVRRAAELIAKVARTVHYAHEHHILHRDIKPGNILLDGKGEPHLTDFGLARLVETESTVTRTMEVLGTPSYMAPEQAGGNNAAITSATDVYGLGAVLYQLLTGHPPFAGGTTFETVRLVLDTEPRQPRLLNPKIDRDLNTICLKCLEKDPKRRYASAVALAEDLERWLKHEPIRAHRTGIFTCGKKWLRRNPSIAVMAAMLLALAVPLGVMIWRTESERSAPSNAAPPEKSIAVLPFSNLSKEQENAFFADGVQDEIVTDLAKVADLKVISRTSVMPYKSGMPRNVREIGQQLGVAHVVEGTVQRAGNRVRVNAQLVDARTDRHLWAQTYDRDLADVFAIQSEIAQKIADQLQVKLSPKEKTAISERPTSDLAAYDLFLRAKELFYDGDVNPSRLRENYFKAVQLLDQALARDPAFLLAHCRLAYAHVLLYWFNFDHTETRLALAETSVRAAVRLQPDSGETHLAQATLFYWGYRDYDRAQEELAKAQHALPNNVQIFMFLGFIDRRQGRWDEAIRNLERALDLDPRNVERLWRLGEIYSSNLRRYGDAIAIVNRALALEPRSAFLRALPAAIGVEADANMAPLRATLDAIEAERPASAAEVANISFQLALRERDPAAAGHALANIPREGKGTTYYSDIPHPHAWFEGLLAKLRQESPAAHSAFKAARAETEKLVRAQPGNVTPLNVLALIDAELGEKEKAIQEGRTVCDMIPVARDAVDGVGLVTDLARIYALTGEKDLALKQLEIVSRIPCGPSYGELRLDSEWDPLRGDPRFEKLVEESKQPVTLTASASGALSAPNFAPAPEKSIAVLPFENLSRDPDNAFFANGMQDEILTDLSKIADLKVISRTSVMPYKTGIARNLREIGQQLGVAHVVEGSVQRSSNRVRVNAQLLDARTDRHLWGQTYDRDMADVFAIQSEIAKTIADQLQAKLSPREEDAIQRAPTSDISAFDLYTRAKNILLRTGSIGKADTLQAVDLLTQAVARDPSFFDAYCQLAYAHDALYFFGDDHTSARLALAEAALQAASRLRPDAGETHLARGQNLYWAYGDYDGALAELEVARQTLRNDPRIFELTGLIQRRQGRWEESTRNLERAVELNPGDIGTLVLGVASNYLILRRYAEAKPWSARALAFEPNNALTKVWLAWLDYAWKADTRPLHQTIDSIWATSPAPVPSIAEFWLVCALAERDAAAAKDALMAFGEEPISFAVENVRFNRPFAEGVIARMTKDDEKARSAFTAARAEQEKIVQAQPNYGPALCALGLIDAGLGRKDDALREGRRAVELLPVEKDSMNGTNMVRYLAIIAAWVGDKDLACEQLARIMRRPSNVSYGQLKLLPFWDPLRGDPRFEKLVEESKQPVALK